MQNKERSAVSWLMEFAGEKRIFYIVSVVAAIIGVICSVTPFLFVSDIVIRLIERETRWSGYLMDGVAIAVLWMLRYLFHGISTCCSHKATFQVLANIRKRLCDKLAKVPLGKVKDTPSGALKNIIVERVDSIETTLAHVVPEFTSNLLAPVVVFMYLCILDWRMALASLITLVFGIVAYMFMMVGYQESFQNTINKTKILNDTAVEYINGIEVIKAFGKAQSSYEKFEVAAKEGADCYVEWMRRCNVPFCIAMVVMPCTALATVPIGGFLFMKGSLSLSTLVMCLILSMGLVTPLITVMSYSDDIGKMGSILGEVTGVLSWEEQLRPINDNKQIKDYSICLENVRFSYREKEVLHGVNLKIESGTVNALVGPSGSGKSTIAKLIASLWDVDSGSIKIGGVDISELSLKNYNRKIAYVSQDNYLFDNTIRENIRMGDLNATDKQVEQAAKDCGCHEFIMALPDGYDTIVGSAGGHLSGGERQRISIARAMLKNAPIIILDEATAYTDPENEALIQHSVGFIAMVGMVLFFTVNSFLQRKSKALAPVKAASDEFVVEKVLEYVQGISEVRSYNLTGCASKELNEAIDKNRDINTTMELKTVPWMQLQSIILKLMGVAIILTSCGFYLAGSMTLQNCIGMIICSFLVFESLGSAGNYSTLLRVVDISVSKVENVMKIKEMDIDGKDIIPKNFDIDVENVDFYYDENHAEDAKIINHLSVHIPERTTTAIVGPSGGGKTTLCHLISRFWDVSNGNISLGGENVRNYSVDSLMKNFSFVFQNVYLFEDTIANNIRFGQPEASMELVMDAAKKACCHDFIMELPNGYDTVIGEGGTSLSGGEKQRISIARAIMKDAPVIILDEATANVDPENEKELMSAIEALTKEKTILMIAHRLKTVEHADQILVLDKGQIVQQGRHSELLKQTGIYRKFILEREEAVGWKI